MRPLGLALALALLVVSTVSARSLQPRIVNGVSTTAHPSVGALLSGSSPATAWLRCSGTLVGCRTFLTAAHCVCDRGGAACQPGASAAPDPRRFFVFLQHAGMVAVESIAVHPAYDFPIADVAVVRLAAPVTAIRPSRLNVVATPGPGTPGTIVGFGRQGGSVDDYGLKREGAVTLAPCASVPADSLLCWAFTAPLGMPGTNSNTCEGDSGGPLFVDLGSGPVLAGVTSGGVASACLPPDESYDADLFRYRNWIASESGSDLGQPACGTGTHVGDPGLEVVAFAGALDAAVPAATFAFAIPADLAALRVTLNGDDRADFDLYLRHDSPPSTTAFDCKDDGASQFAACLLQAPAGGVWHALVQRYAGSGAFQLTATLLPDDDACRELPDGTLCDDGDPCTHDDACAAGTCRGTTAPRSGCLQSTTRNGSLSVRDSTRTARDRFTWRWGRGDVPAQALGMPHARSELALCVYETAGGQPRLVTSQRIPGGPAWRSWSQGWRYSDRRGTTGGLTRVVLAAGSSTSGYLMVKARGPGFLPPPLPLHQEPAVIVQLLAHDLCFETQHPSAVANNAARFQAREDP